MFVLSKFWTPGQQFHGEAIDRLAILCMRFCIMYFDSPDVTLMPSYNFGFLQLSPAGCICTQHMGC